MSYHEATVDRKILLCSIRCTLIAVIVVIVINNQLLVISELEGASELALYIKLWFALIKIVTDSLYTNSGRKLK